MSRIVTEEIFDPVAPVVTWQQEAELLNHVNGTEYGLAAYVFSGRLQHALRLAESFEAGMVGINRGVVSDPAAPFGGVKQSGLGREGGREGIREFQESQYFSVDLGDLPHHPSTRRSRVRRAAPARPKADARPCRDRLVRGSGQSFRRETDAQIR
jgi:delta 1-pyrroline-5-carboxylate dehydrogenase